MKKMNKMKKIILAMFCFCNVLLAVSCASPEDEIVGGRDGHGTSSITEDDTSQGSSANEKSEGDIRADQGRHITVTYGSGEYVFHIDADVRIPEASIVSGNLVIKEIDISRIEQYLCAGDSLVWDDASNMYVSQTDTVTTDEVSYDRCFYTADNGAAAVFDDLTKDEYYQSMGTHTVSAQDQTKEDQVFMNSMMQESTEILNHLQVDMDYSHIWYEISDDKNRYCSVFFNALMKDAPLVSPNDGSFLQGYVQLGEYGVNSIHFSGLYEADEAEEISNVMTLDEVLALVRQGVEEKNINTQTYTISSISLVYMINESSMTFSPAWCFAGAIDVDLGNVPLLCIDAVTGDVLMMW